MSLYGHTPGRPGIRYYNCDCGKVVKGNAAKWSHRRACDGRWMHPTEVYASRRVVNEDYARGYSDGFNAALQASEEPD